MIPNPEVTGSLHQAPATISFDRMMIPEDELRPARHALFHSSGPGYVIFRQFIKAEVVAHIQDIWCNIDHTKTHTPFASKDHFYEECPDYVNTLGDQGVSFYNFFINNPYDEVTWTVSLYAHMIRNRLSNRGPFAEIFPFSGRQTSYRVVITRNSETWLAPHRDYLYGDRNDKSLYDLSRLQATLFLSRKHEDYSGIGFSFELNNGTPVVFGDDVILNPGDLAVWRYNNLHGVTDVRSRTDQRGFIRITLPPEFSKPRPAG